MFVRTPSKQKSPKKGEDIDIVELLRGHEPKDYERILREHGIHDYRAILQAIEFLKKEKEMQTGRPVRYTRRHLQDISVNVKGHHHKAERIQDTSEDHFRCWFL